MTGAGPGSGERKGLLPGAGGGGGVVRVAMAAHSASKGSSRMDLETSCCQLPAAEWVELLGLL